jgi:hypothetical protein
MEPPLALRKFLLMEERMGESILSKLHNHRKRKKQTTKNTKAAKIFYNFLFFAVLVFFVVCFGLFALVAQEQTVIS